MMRMAVLVCVAMMGCVGCGWEAPMPEVSGEERVCLYTRGEPRCCVGLQSLGEEGRQEVALLLRHAMRHGSFRFGTYAPQMMISSGRWTMNVWEDRVIVNRLRRDGSPHWVQGVAVLSGEEKVLAQRIRERVGRLGAVPRLPEGDGDAGLYFEE